MEECVFAVNKVQKNNAWNVDGELDDNRQYGHTNVESSSVMPLL